MHDHRPIEPGEGEPAAETGRRADQHDVAAMVARPAGGAEQDAQPDVVEGVDAVEIDRDDLSPVRGDQFAHDLVEGGHRRQIDVALYRQHGERTDRFDRGAKGHGNRKVPPGAEVAVPMAHDATTVTSAPMTSTRRRIAVLALVAAGVAAPTVVRAADDPLTADGVQIADVSGLAPATRTITFVPHAFPIESGRGTYEPTHHDYPATDIALPCGTALVAAVDGEVWEVDRVDRWNAATDVPSTRGGRTVVIDGDDDVRYLYAHLSAIDSGLAVGQRVRAGQRIATIGTTGRSTGCHLHLGLSPRCTTRIWDRLAGTVWPWPYLDAWRRGENLSPGPEVEAWLAAHPGGCGSSAVIALDDPATRVVDRLGE